MTPSRLAAWAGSERLPFVAARRDELAARPITPASAPLALLVAGAGVRADWIPDATALVEHGLITIDDGLARATACVLPLGRALLVCDAPHDAAVDAVSWPDDSSEHL